MKASQRKITRIASLLGGCRPGYLEHGYDFVTLCLAKDGFELLDEDSVLEEFGMAEIIGVGGANFSDYTDNRKGRLAMAKALLQNAIDNPLPVTIDFPLSAG